MAQSDAKHQNSQQKADYIYIILSEKGTVVVVIV